MRHLCGVDCLFDLTRTRAAALLAGVVWPWEAISQIDWFLREMGATLAREGFLQPAPDVWVARSARVDDSAFLGAPCVIDEEAEVRHGAFIRGSAMIGRGAVVGNATEIKNALLFDGVQAPHYNYIGDSILGWRAHMGAGAVLSNVRADHRDVTVRAGGQAVQTGLRKLGGMLGDLAELGCGCVVAPGGVVGRGASAYPNSFVRGYVPAGHIYKDEHRVIKREERV